MEQTPLPPTAPDYTEPAVSVAWIPSLIGVGLVLTVIRILVVVLSHPGNSGIGYQILTGVLAAAILTVVVVALVVQFRRTRLQDVSYEQFTSVITTYVVSSLALIVFSSIVPQGGVDSPHLWQRLLVVIANHLIAIGAFTVSAGLAGFIIMVLLIRRHQRTQMLLRTVAGLIVVVWISAILVTVSIDFQPVLVLSAAASAVAVLLNIRRMSWLKTLTLNKKVRIFWLTVLGLFTTVFLAPNLAFNAEVPLSMAMDDFLVSGRVVPALLTLYGMLFFGRVMIATLVALPNSGLVDRRSSEVDALTALTRKIAQAVSLEELLGSIANDAYAFCQAHGAWVELYDTPKELSPTTVRVVGAVAVGSDYVHLLHRDPGIDQLLRTTPQAVHIDSVPDITSNSLVPVAVGSMIAVPLTDGTQRLGTLVVISTMEYGLEAHDVRLLSSFADVVTVAVEQARLTEQALARQNMQQEMAVARSIQRSLLPRQSFPSDGWMVDAVMVSAAEVGGDYYDYIEFANGHRGVLIADVSGKGVPAALIMATLKGVVLAEMRSAHGPADLIRRIHAAVWGALDRRTYITLTCVEVPNHGSILRYARAGHTPLLIKQHTAVRALRPAGIAVGLVAPEHFATLIEDEETDVGPGGICLLTTDGVNERRNRSAAELGFEPLEGMLEAFDTHTPPLPATIVRHTLQILDDYGGGEPPHDDITIVALVYHHPSPKQ